MSPEVEAPHGDADKNRRQLRAEREDNVGDDQQRESEREQSDAADAIGKFSGRIGRRDVGEIHHHERERRPDEGQAGVVGPQHEKRLAESARV